MAAAGAGRGTRSAASYRDVLQVALSRLILLVFTANADADDYATRLRLLINGLTIETENPFLNSVLRVIPAMPQKDAQRVLLNFAAEKSKASFSAIDKMTLETLQNTIYDIQVQQGLKPLKTAAAFAKIIGDLERLNQALLLHDQSL